MQERHDLGQLGPVEVHRSDPGIVPTKTEIDGVSAIFHGSQKTHPISCGRQQLRLHTEFRRKRRCGRGRVDSQAWHELNLIGHGRVLGRNR